MSRNIWGRMWGIIWGRIWGRRTQLFLLYPVKAAKRAADGEPKSVIPDPEDEEPGEGAKAVLRATFLSPSQPKTIREESDLGQNLRQTNTTVLALSRHLLVCLGI